ncbi:uncharacterized protein LOC130934505 [Arachis stenosperma]|uniref:uncharacterized protein LOC130934505 n=1 Tax=Arachis stenosperma TaxID=217475 RepID=UPI0025ACD36D|nr:uncharacterized protein LOC130934505 [Arachis stenosperma]
MEMILQDYAKLDSDTIANAIRLLVEADPLIKMKSIIAEVQSRFNYIVRYRKTLPVWLKVMCAKLPISHVQIKALPVYYESEEVNGVKVLYQIFWSFYPYITAFRHCKPLV